MKLPIMFLIVFFIAPLFSENSSRPLYLRVTPNNDNKNDTFIYRCYNPKDLAVKGEIFDLYGKKIGDMKILTQKDYYYYLEWVPPSNIKGGIYLYQIIIGESKFKGVFVVIK